MLTYFLVWYFVIHFHLGLIVIFNQIKKKNFYQNQDKDVTRQDNEY